MRIVEKPFSYSSTTYYSFTIEKDDREYEWTLIAYWDDNWAYTNYELWEWNYEATEEDIKKWARFPFTEEEESEIIEMLKPFIS